MSIYIKRGAQEFITDAKVTVHYFMPSLPGKPPMMEYDTEATVGHLGSTMKGPGSIRSGVPHGRLLKRGSVNEEYRRHLLLL